MMAPGAVWTGAHLETPLVFVIMNNRSWGNDELHQREVAAYRGRTVERAHIGQRTEDPAPDLSAVARAFGAWAEGPIDDPDKIAAGLRAAVEEAKKGRVAVVEVITSLD